MELGCLGAAWLHPAKAKPGLLAGDPGSCQPLLGAGRQGHLSQLWGPGPTVHRLSVMCSHS